MNFRPIAVWCVLFSLLAHAASDVGAAPLRAPSVCEAQSLIATMVGHTARPASSVCDLQRALKLRDGAPAPSLPDEDSSYQATLLSSTLVAPQGLHFLQAGIIARVETVSALHDFGVSVGLSMPELRPKSSCPFAHQIAPHAPPQLS